MDVVTASADERESGSGSGLIRYFGYVPVTVLGFAALTYLALGIALLALFLLAVAAGSTVVDHLGHALRFLFGGAVEAIYVFERYGEDGEEGGDPDFMHQRR